MIVWLHGFSGAGKTTVGQMVTAIYRANNPNAIVGYVEPLHGYKRQVERTFGLDFGTLDTQEGKDTPLKPGYTYRQYLIDLWKFHREVGVCATATYLKRALDNYDIIIASSIRNKEEEEIIKRNYHLVNHVWLEGGKQLDSDEETDPVGLFVPWMETPEQRATYITENL